MPVTQPITFTVANADVNGDGYNSHDDGDDNDTSIYPSTTDLDGTGLDENWSGADTLLTVNNLYNKARHCAVLDN